MSRRIAIEDRFWAKVDKGGQDSPSREGGPCWLWTSTLTPDGYPRLRRENREDGYLYAHRFAYELLIGPIPTGLTLDHLCRIRRCVNPEHLEPVTNAENVLRGNGITARQARQTHCKRGHPLSGDNLYTYRGTRICKTCKRERTRR